jgi:hypothetical protein
MFNKGPFQKILMKTLTIVNEDLTIMDIHDIRIIIGEYLKMNEIDILSDIFNTYEWNVYDEDHYEYGRMITRYNHKHLKISGSNRVPEDVYAITLLPAFGYPDEFPDNVHIIKLNHDFSDEFPETLPRYLHTLWIDNSKITIDTDILPNYLYDLRLCMISIKFNKVLPRGLRILHLNRIRNYIKNITMPRNLIELDISESSIDNIDNISPTLRILNIKGSKIGDPIYVNKLPKDLIIMSLWS